MRQLTWRARQACGCDAALRPRARATRGPREAQVAWVAQTRGKRPRDPLGRLCGEPRGKGGWRIEGPWVSGPWLGDWGSNANAILHPTFYTKDFHFFLSCGTMFPHISSVQVTSRLRKRRIQSGQRRLRGPESTRSLIKARAPNLELVATFKGLTW